jgi:hypothetical protein
MQEIIDESLPALLPVEWAAPAVLKFRGCEFQVSRLSTKQFGGLSVASLKERFSQSIQALRRIGNELTVDHGTSRRACARAAL